MANIDTSRNAPDFIGDPWLGLPAVGFGGYAPSAVPQRRQAPGLPPGGGGVSFDWNSVPGLDSVAGGGVMTGRRPAGLFPDQSAMPALSNPVYDIGDVHAEPPPMATPATTPPAATPETLSRPSWYEQVAPGATVPHAGTTTAAPTTGTTAPATTTTPQRYGDDYDRNLSRRENRYEGRREGVLDAIQNLIGGNLRGLLGGGGGGLGGLGALAAMALGGGFGRHGGRGFGGRFGGGRFGGFGPRGFMGHPGFGGRFGPHPGFGGRFGGRFAPGALRDPRFWRGPYDRGGAGGGFDVGDILDAVTGRREGDGQRDTGDYLYDSAGNLLTDQAGNPVRRQDVSGGQVAQGAAAQPQYIGPHWDAFRRANPDYDTLTPSEQAVRTARWSQQHPDLPLETPQVGGRPATTPAQYPYARPEGTPEAPAWPIDPRTGLPTEGGVDPATSNPDQAAGGTPTPAPGAMLAATGEPPKAFIFHHTGGGGDVAGVQSTLRQRGLGVEYVMDRDGRIYRTGNPGASHMMTGWGRGQGLNNRNTIGMEVIARNNRDVTPAQIASARRFIQQMYPNTPVFGHGEVNPGHKEADEGMAIVGPIRSQRETSRAERFGYRIGQPDNNNQVALNLPNGQNALLNATAAQAFQGFLGDLHAAGAPLGGGDGTGRTTDIEADGFRRWMSNNRQLVAQLTQKHGITTPPQPDISGWGFDGAEGAAFMMGMLA